MTAEESHLKEVLGSAAIGTSRKQVLSRTVRDRIRALVMDGALLPDTQLPPEPELANILGVSRVVVREALIVLEHEGTVIRRQGLGTFITANPLLPRRYDLNLSATENLRCLGQQLGVSQAKAEPLFSDAEWAERLDVPIGTPLVSFRGPG